MMNNDATFAADMAALKEILAREGRPKADPPEGVEPYTTEHCRSLLRYPLADELMDDDFYDPIFEDAQAEKRRRKRTAGRCRGAGRG